MRTMVICIAELTGYAGVRHIWVTLPFVPALIDGRKYREPGDMPRLEGSEAYRARAPRGPTLRSLVKLARRCDNAEQLGLELRKRYQRQQARRGIAPAGNARAEAEVDRILGECEP
jgi:hypothetical protein